MMTRSTVRCGYSWLPPDSPNCMIRHVSEAHNHEFYSHFLLFSTTIKVPTIVQKVL
jgi:hypothetical protein